LISKKHFQHYLVKKGGGRNAERRSHRTRGYGSDDRTRHGLLRWLWRTRLCHPGARSRSRLGPRARLVGRRSRLGRRWTWLASLVLRHRTTPLGTLRLSAGLGLRPLWTTGDRGAGKRAAQEPGRSAQARTGSHHPAPGRPRKGSISFTSGRVNWDVNLATRPEPPIRPAPIAGATSRGMTLYH
jgi:hypothetical protein